MNEERTQEFLEELTRLSHEYGVYITNVYDMVCLDFVGDDQQEYVYTIWENLSGLFFNAPGSQPHAIEAFRS